MTVPLRGRTIRQLLRQGWTEIPDILAGTGLAIVGVGCGILGCYRYYANDGDNRRYKNTYVIMRSDDPRAKLVHKD